MAKANLTDDQQQGRKIYKLLQRALQDALYFGAEHGSLCSDIAKVMDRVEKEQGKEAVR